VNLPQIFRPKHFSGLKNVKRLLISIPKCIELNSESKLIYFWVWVWIQAQDPTRPKPKCLTSNDKFDHDIKAKI